MPIVYPTHLRAFGGHLTAYNANPTDIPFAAPDAYHLAKNCLCYQYTQTGDETCCWQNSYTLTTPSQDLEGIYYELATLEFSFSATMPDTTGWDSDGFTTCVSQVETVVAGGSDTGYILLDSSFSDADGSIAYFAFWCYYNPTSWPPTGTLCNGISGWIAFHCSTQEWWFAATPAQLQYGEPAPYYYIPNGSPPTSCILYGGSVTNYNAITGANFAAPFAPGSTMDGYPYSTDPIIGCQSGFSVTGLNGVIQGGIGFGGPGPWGDNGTNNEMPIPIVYSASCTVTNRCCNGTDGCIIDAADCDGNCSDDDGLRQKRKIVTPPEKKLIVPGEQNIQRVKKPCGCGPPGRRKVR